MNLLTKKTIVFRVDGNESIGLGHLFRSMALAQTLQQDYNCICATRCSIPGMIQQLQQSFDSVIPLAGNGYSEEIEFLENEISQQDLWILDGYTFDTAYQEILRNKGIDFFCIDDIHAYRFLAKVVINHSGGLSPLDYQSEPGTQFYLGPGYALLAKEYLASAKAKLKWQNNQSCFVCFGGADPGNKTLQLLQKMAVSGNSLFSNYHVVVGGAYKYFDQLQSFASGKNHIELHRSLPPEQMVSLMQKCSFAICSPSTIVYEYMSIGGGVFLEQIADNQKDVINYFTSEGFAFTLDQVHSISESEILESIKKQSLYFDGCSGERLKKIFSQFFLSKHMSIRKAAHEDLNICFDWANDPLVRSQSYSTSPILWEDHSNWFAEKLADKNSFFYILQMNAELVAQIRFQVNLNEATLSYLAGNELRSKGLGTAILSIGITQFVSDYKKNVNIIGFVKKSNIASQKSFEKLKFIKEESTENLDSYKYTLEYAI
jgi:UDP-2,4-diacetamido-2,4,6-trideoxy-beta-L-altropyranose hydrolase